MSWQPYVDDHLMAELSNGGKLSNAAIVSHDGGIWAQTAEFPAITVAQVQDIMKGLDDPAALGATGIRIGEEPNLVKYFLIPSEAGSVLRGRIKTDGVVIKKTATALVIGMFGEGVQAGDASVRVEDLGDYLIQQGY